MNIDKEFKILVLELLLLIARKTAYGESYTSLDLDVYRYIQKIKDN